MTVSLEDHGPVAALTGSQSRRTALHAGSALLAGMSALAFPVQRSVAQATPTADTRGGDLLLVQSFSQGSLFPTQGDAEGPPYTVILWDAADRGFFFADWTGGVAGVVPTDRVLAGIGAATPARAVLVPGPTAGDDPGPSIQGVWALNIVSGSPGSDPGAVTYQGEPLAGEDATPWLGAAPAALPDGPQELGQGFLILTGLSEFDAGGDGVRLNLT